MEILVSCLLAIIAALQLWQAFFQNNIVLFQKRIELYQDFVGKLNLFFNYAEYLNTNLSHMLDKKNECNNSQITQEKEELLRKYSNLEGVISSMMYVGFSDELKNILRLIVKNSTSITDYFTQTINRKSEVTRIQLDASLHFLKKMYSNNAEVNILFNFDVLFAVKKVRTVKCLLLH